MSYYKKKTYRRRRPRKSTPWYQRKYNAMQLAAKSWRAVKYIKGLVNSEMLHKDFAYSAGTSIPNTGFITNITALAQGDTTDQRTGNSILLRSLSYRYKIEINSSVTSNTAVLFMLVKDTQQLSDTSPSVTDILTSATPESLMNLTTAGRFKILKRQIILLSPASGGSPAKEISGYRKIYDHVRYNGTASSDIQKNGYYVIMLSSENTNYPTVAGSMRIGYHDN